jgi:hypothetical protein
MATTAPPSPDGTLGSAPGEHCATCAAPLAGDQQYCLNCGRRVGPERADLLGALRGPHPAVDVVVPPAPPSTPARACGRRSAAPALARLLALGLLVGALLWSGGEERPIVVNVPRDEAPRVNVNVPAGGGTAVAAEFTSDWPGDDGWTIQLEALPKDGTDPRGGRRGEVRRPPARAPTTSARWTPTTTRAWTRRVRRLLRRLRVQEGGAQGPQGAAQGLPRRQGRRGGGLGGGGATPKVDKDAEKASDSDLKELQNAKGDDFVKKSKKLKDKVVTGGATPKTDNKKPGGGEGGGAVIE